MLARRPTSAPRRSLAFVASASSSSSNGSKGANLSPEKQDVQTTTRRKALISGVATTTAIATSVVVVPGTASAETATSTSSPPSPPSVVRAPAAALTPRERDAVAAYELAAPSVVNVFDLTLIRGGGVALGSGAAEPEGNGSGVLWRDGVTGALVVVTNYHVLASSLDRIKDKQIGRGVSSPGPTVARVVVSTPDGKRRALDAAVAGVDASHDLAVLVLLGSAASASGNGGGGGGDDFFSRLRAIERAETSSGLKVGQQVLALGHPFGFDLTLTSGLVSGTGRSFESKVSSSAPSAPSGGGGRNGVISGAIQHSAPINPGSSGGPLLDSRGRLVGLSTAIYTDTGSNVGLGFALPVDLLERVVPQLVAGGSATTLGAGVGLATPAVAAALLPPSSLSSSPSVSQGVMIASVAPGSGADKAGLLPVRRTIAGVAAGDVVVAVGGRACADAGAFAAALEEISSSTRGVSSSPSTAEVEFDVVRGVGTGQQRREKVIVALAPE